MRRGKEWSYLLVIMGIKSDSMPWLDWMGFYSISTPQRGLFAFSNFNYEFKVKLICLHGRQLERYKGAL